MGATSTPTTPTVVLSTQREAPPLPVRRRPVPILRLEDEAPSFPIDIRGRRGEQPPAPRLAPRRGALVEPAALASTEDLLAFFHPPPPPVHQEISEDTSLPEMINTPSPVRRIPLGEQEPPLMAVGVTLQGITSSTGSDTKIPFLDVMAEEAKGEEDVITRKKTTLSFRTTRASAFHQVVNTDPLHNNKTPFVPVCHVLKMKTNIQELKDAFSSLVIQREVQLEPSDSPGGD